MPFFSIKGKGDSDHYGESDRRQTHIARVLKAPVPYSAELEFFSAVLSAASVKITLTQMPGYAAYPVYRFGLCLNNTDSDVGL